MLKYRGWRLVAIVDMPRAYEIKDLIYDVYGSIRFGQEIKFKQPYRPEKFGYTLRFLANKSDDEPLSAKTVSGLKKKIDEIENNR